MAVKLERDADQDSAVNDADSYHLYREAARLFFRCSKMSIDSELRDIATLDYAYDVRQSTRTNGDVIEIFPQIDAVLNELIFSSKIAGLRTGAMSERR